MRVLLDECLPRRLKDHLPGHEVRTVPEMGWAGTKDSALLQIAASHFDAFITVDRGLPRSRGEAARSMIIVVLTAPTNRLTDLKPLMSSVVEALQIAVPGHTIRLGPAS